MNIHAYPWLVSAYDQLAAPIIQQRAHHAWLIHYVAGCGEAVLITHFAARLLCAEPVGLAPCGHCHSCLLFAAQTHPDFYRLHVENDKKFISVDQVRLLTEKVYEHAQQGGAKVIWIAQATLMTEAAANALLKTLEEPPANTFFILSDDKSQQLMATLRSRCVQFTLTPPNLDESLAWLKQRLGQAKAADYSDNQLAAALLLSRQAPLAAIALLDPALWQRRQQFCEQLSQVLTTRQFWPLLSLLNSPQVQLYLHWFSALILDASKAKNRAGKFVTNRDQVPLIRQMAQIETDVLHQWYALWQTAAQRLMTISGLNQELILADLLAQSELLFASCII